MSDERQGYQFGENFCKYARNLSLWGLAVSAVVNLIAHSPISPLPHLPVHYCQKLALCILFFGVMLFLFETLNRELNRTYTILAHTILNKD